MDEMPVLLSEINDVPIIISETWKFCQVFFEKMLAGTIFMHVNDQNMPNQHHDKLIQHHDKLNQHDDKLNQHDDKLNQHHDKLNQHHDTSNQHHDKLNQYDYKLNQYDDKARNRLAPLTSAPINAPW